MQKHFDRIDRLEVSSIHNVTRYVTMIFDCSNITENILYSRKLVSFLIYMYDAFGKC